MTNDPHAEASARLSAMFSEKAETQHVGISAADLAWNRADRETRAIKSWLTRIHPSYAAAVPLERPNPFTHGAIAKAMLANRDALFQLLEYMFPGDRILAWEACGKPKALRHWAGLDEEPLSEHDWLLEMWFDCGDGRRPLERGSDGRSKAVMDVVTRQVWPSVTALSDDIGTSRVYLYHHLSGRAKSVKGRIFQYVE